MARIIGIDFGLKRCGLAATDELQIAVHPVSAVTRAELDDFLHTYLKENNVESVVIGMPQHRDGSKMEWTAAIDVFKDKLQKQWPDLPVHYQDESFTSYDAAQILAKTNSKKTRKQKSKLDVLSAVLILQRFLNHI